MVLLQYGDIATDGESRQHGRSVLGRDNDGDADEETLEEDLIDSVCSDSVIAGGMGGRLFGAGEDDAKMCNKSLAVDRRVQASSSSISELRVRNGSSSGPFRYHIEATK